MAKVERSQNTGLKFGGRNYCELVVRFCRVCYILFVGDSVESGGVYFFATQF